jgi:hypothetical protein
MVVKRGFRRGGAALIGAGLAVSVLGLAPQALAAGGPPSVTPASGTPNFPASTSSTEQVRQLVQCGSTMYAVGTFTTVKKGSTTYTRNNAFSFSAVAPYTMSSWNPSVNGTVNSIALSANCANAYLGGTFTTVGGTTVKNLAEVSASTGAVVTAFGHSAAGEVDTLAVTGTHLLAGGAFAGINGSTADPYLASLNLTTGKNDGFAHLAISGNYGNGGTKVYNQQISHGGTLDLFEGTFTSVGGQARRQIFMLSLAGPSATVTPWTSPEFNQDCASVELFYVRAASWSPDDGTVYVGTTGYKPATGPDTGLCDAAAAFPVTGPMGPVNHLWVNYTGCDSFYSTAADASTAYFGGHERYASNSQGCDGAGPGAVTAPGMVGLSPATGAVTYNPTRDRGLGADDMLVTSAGLWIASDNLSGSQKCGGVAGHAGICFLPYS